MKVIWSFFFVLFTLALSAQALQDSAGLLQQADRQGIESDEMEAFLAKRKVKFNLEFGTSFAANKYGSYFGTYVAPHITYPVSSRFSLSAGGYFTGVTPMTQGEQVGLVGYPYGSLNTRSYLYVEGAYRLTENLTVTGAAYKEVNLFNQTNSGYPASQYESRGFIMGVDYQVSDHVFIRGQVEVSNGQGPYHYAPFMNPARSRFNDPFFSHP